jgi:hypothetical protein
MPVEKHTELAKEKIAESMKGNQNAKKKLFTDRFRMVFSQNPERVAKIVEGVVEAAEAGEPWAVKEIMDRLEGKPVQATEITGADGAEFVKGIGFVFVDGNAKQD